MKPQPPNVSVVVPTLNEAENIEAIIGKILAGGASLRMEIIVVDDGSRDETQAIVRRLAETLPVNLLARDRPKDGLAGAVLAGARAAKAGVVLVIDADGSHPPEKIPELALPVIRGDRDMVIGSRYAPGGSTPGWSRKRRLMSRAASACAWPLTDVHDALSGFFAVRRELLAAIPSDAAGFKIALEILVRGGDSIRVGEAPIAFRDRELGQSKMGGRVILTYFRRLVALSGWRESDDSMGIAVTKTLLIWLVDFALFAAGLLAHLGLSEANLIGFGAGAVLNGWLKIKQSAPAAQASRHFIVRLVFVSLLSLFLRSGVLAMGALWFGWVAVVAVIPGIIAGWTVLFLGYALFIWPVREQYGAGMRWRVAALGATAYLLALRMVYLYAIPINRGLAALPGENADASLGDRLTAGLVHLGTAILGPNAAGMNLPAFFCWAVMVYALFTGINRAFDKTTAFRSMLLFSVLPVFFWTGSQFGPVTVFLTACAVILWSLSFLIRWKYSVAAGIGGGILLVACFPWIEVNLGAEGLIRLALFVPIQVILATPVAVIAAWRYFTHWKRGERRPAGKAAAICGMAGGVLAIIAYAANGRQSTVSGALWLPLLPLVASEMENPESPPGRWWTPVLYCCVIGYGTLLYWLAFSA
jgi:dolichol-phosphate mannosyltransferase